MTEKPRELYKEPSDEELRQIRLRLVEAAVRYVATRPASTSSDVVHFARDYEKYVLGRRHD